MLFNSTLFLAFLTAVVVVYYHLPLRGRRLLLLAASYSFYWVWSIPFSLLLVGSTVVDYVAARVIGRARTKAARVAGLLASIIANLGVLAVFKYADFFTNSTYSLLGVRPWAELDLILPLGISFYTFQTMSYTIDVFRGHMAPKKSLLDVALYVSFFPQLVAGPIVRADVLMPQLAEKHEIDWERIRRGMALVLWGLAKKVFIADSMARIVNEAYGDPASQSGLGLLIATYAFAVQIYCDFSGYSDIAIGAANLLGIRLPKNFDAPYLACSIREFWRRWHISLSTWLRDYLYISLGGSRVGRARTYVNLMFTMLLGGLWHGAGWNWVIWGGLHGVIMSGERALNLSETPPTRTLTRLLRWAITFHLICFSWIFFRSANLDQAANVIHRIATMADGRVPLDPRPLFALALLLLAERAALKTRWLGLFAKHPTAARWITYLLVIVFVLSFSKSGNPEFIYFQF